MSRFMKVEPGPLSGAITVPPSKSIYHRALILSALSDKGGRIRPYFRSDDIDATKRVLTALGAKIEKSDMGNAYLVYPVTKKGSSFVTAHCGESGSTVRFLIPIAAALGKSVTFEGSGRLPERPLTPYYTLLEEHGVKVQRQEGAHLPLSICGKLQGGVFSLRGDISSQFITGLMIAAGLMEEKSVLHLETPLQSAPYVEITRNVLELFGVKTTKQGDDFIIPGNQRFASRDFTVESDWSQAAFYFMAGVLGSSLTLSGLSPDSLQGDKQIARIAEQFGAKVAFSRGMYHISPPEGEIHPIHIKDASDIPDIIPVIAVTAAFANGTSVIENAGRLRIKESDRLLSAVLNIRAIGGSARAEGDALIIEGLPSLPGGMVDACGDHRVVMAFSIAGTRCENGVRITGAGAVEKSYPTFFDDFISLGGAAHELTD